MIGWRRTTPCERASQWISLELDDELSELESAALDRHLERCGPCRALSAELTAMTVLIREAEPVEPWRQIALPAPRRPRTRVASRIALLATFAASVAAIAALLTSNPLGGSPRALAFASERQQIRFVHNKYLQMEPLRTAALSRAAAATVPAFSRRALR